MKHTSVDTRTLVAVFAALLVTLAARSAAADTITLAWDPNADDTVVGYYVHVGTSSGSYSQHIDVGLSTVYGWSDAVAGQRYCFAVSAYQAGPVEGPKSAEVCGYSSGYPVLVNPGNISSVIGQAVTLQLQGSDPDGQPVSYSASGLPPGLNLMASTGFISGTLTTAGSYTVTATVSDGVLQSSQTFGWAVSSAASDASTGGTGSGTDTAPPSITITGPTSAESYTTTASTMTLSGTASDNFGVAQVTWSTNRGSGGTASGTSNWSVSVPLAAGTNKIIVTARDAAGNDASDMITVATTGSGGSGGSGGGTDTTPPSIKITGPTSTGSYTTTASTMTLSGTASDDFGVAQVTWSSDRGNGGTATGTSNWSGSVPLAAGTNNIIVTARDAAGNDASDVITVTTIASTGSAGSIGGGSAGLRGDYYSGSNFDSLITTRIDPTVDFEWGYGSADANLPVDNFSVRWTGMITVPVTGTYTFVTSSDDGVRLWVGNQLMIDNWTDHSSVPDAGPQVWLQAGQQYPVRLEYYDNTGWSVMQLYWTAPGQWLQIIPQSALTSTP
jgi:PA14 domain/Putative Ig domain/Glucodextranase, domain B